MHDLRIIRNEDFDLFTKENNLKDLSQFGNNFFYELDPSKIIVNENLFSLPSLKLRNFVNIVVNLPKATIHGNKLATIYNGYLLPSGYSHSFNWVEVNGFNYIDEFRCYGESFREIDISNEGFEYFILGITSHFGHFFVDGLDRLMAFDRLVKNIKNVRFIVDAIPSAHIMKIINLLGIKVVESNFVILENYVDYKLNDLKVSSLNSAKPAISLESFKEFRSRAIKSIDSQVNDKTRGIYVGRKNVEKRSVVNQSEIETYLGSIGISSYYPEENNFEETIAKFNSVDIVIIVIGSSKFNLSLCRPGTKVICLTPLAYVENSGPVSIMLRQLCFIFKLHLCFCSCEIVGLNYGLNSDLRIDINSLKASLKTLEIF